MPEYCIGVPDSLDRCAPPFGSVVHSPNARGEEMRNHVLAALSWVLVGCPAKTPSTAEAPPVESVSSAVPPTEPAPAVFQPTEETKPSEQQGGEFNDDELRRAVGACAAFNQDGTYDNAPGSKDLLATRLANGKWAVEKGVLTVQGKQVARPRAANAPQDQPWEDFAANVTHLSVHHTEKTAWITGKMGSVPIGLK